MRWVAALFASVCMSAHADSNSMDASDLWWNANESGWGVNVVQQGATLFLTFFVYDAGGNAAWVVAPSTNLTSAPATMPAVYSGPLYRTTGPFFGGTFNPSNVGISQVGSATFTLTDVNSATLTYSVDNVSVTKSVTRQTWKNNDLSGSYLGATIGTYSFGCPTVGYQEEPSSINIAQTGTSFSMDVRSTLTNNLCSYSGTYGQGGQMGSITGTFSCNNGFTGQFQASELHVTRSGITGRASLQSGACTWSGRVGGLKRGTGL